jgi:hypothetical protein
VTRTLRDFEQIIYADFEFIARHGEHPDVVCLAWREEPGGQTRCLWRDQLGADPPYRTDDRVLFVSFVANAELCCHLALDWALPANVIDLSAEFRLFVNGRVVPEGKGLLGALAYFNFDRIDAKLKDATRDRIIKGWPFSPEEREQILRYGASDVDPLPLLFAELVSDNNLRRALHYGESVAGLALMEHHGVPIDRPKFDQLADERTWSAVRDAMVPVVDADYGVYVKGADGEWHFNLERLGDYCHSVAPSR